MKFDCQNILQWTEAQLKYTYDVSLKDASAEELHEALGKSVMMAISDNWRHSKKTRETQRKAYYFSAEYLVGRLVYSNLFNMGILDEMKALFAERGVDLAILQELDASAANNDFKSFMAIVKEYAPSGGKKFISSVLDNYTTTGFLTDNRYASLLADIISVI